MDQSRKSLRRLLFELENLVSQGRVSQNYDLDDLDHPFIFVSVPQNFWRDLRSINESIQQAMLASSDSLSEEVVARLRAIREQIYKYLDHISATPAADVFDTKYFEEFRNDMLDLISKSLSSQALTHIDQIQKDLNFELADGIFPKDVTLVINRSWSEALTGYSNNCWLSAIGLAGKTLETVLRAKVAQFSNKDGIDENLFMNDAVKKLRQQGFQLDPGTQSMLDFTRKARNYSVHGNTFLPNGNQAMAVLLFSKEFLNLLCKPAATVS